MAYQGPGTATGQVAVWNGSKWVPQPASAASIVSVLQNDGAGTLSWTDPAVSTVDNTLQGALGRVRLSGIWGYIAGGLGGFPSASGWTAVGGVTSHALDFSSKWNSLPSVVYTSSGAAGNNASQRQSSSFGIALASNSGVGGFTVTIRAGTQTTCAGARSFFGLTSSNAAIGNVDPSSLLNIVGFGNDTADANLSFMYNDGSGTATKVALGASFPAQTSATDLYEMTVWAAPGQTTSVSYRITHLFTGATATAAVTSNLPASNTPLFAHAWLNNAATAASVGLNMCSIVTQVPI